MSISKHNLFENLEFLAKRAKTEVEKETVYNKVFDEAIQMIKDMSNTGVTFGENDIHFFIDVNESINEFTKLMDHHIFDYYIHFILELEKEHGGDEIEKFLSNSHLAHMFKMEEDEKKNATILELRHNLWKHGLLGLNSVKNER